LIGEQINDFSNVVEMLQRENRSASMEICCATTGLSTGNIFAAALLCSQSHTGLGSKQKAAAAAAAASQAAANLARTTGWALRAVIQAGPSGNATASNGADVLSIEWDTRTDNLVSRHSTLKVSAGGCSVYGANASTSFLS